MKMCAFTMHIREPDETLKRLAVFFQDRKIVLETLHLHRYKSGEANVIVHCAIERDRIARTFLLLQEVKGIAELTKMTEK